MENLNLEVLNKEMERLAVLENRYTEIFLTNDKSFDRPTLKYIRDQADFYRSEAAKVRGVVLGIIAQSANITVEVVAKKAVAEEVEAKPAVVEAFVVAKPAPKVVVEATPVPEEFEVEADDEEEEGPFTEVADVEVKTPNKK